MTFFFFKKTVITVNSCHVTSSVDMYNRRQVKSVFKKIHVIPRWEERKKQSEHYRVEYFSNSAYFLLSANRRPENRAFWLVHLKIAAHAKRHLNVFKLNCGATLSEAWN